MKKLFVALPALFVLAAFTAPQAEAHMMHHMRANGHMMQKHCVIKTQKMRNPITHRMFTKRTRVCTLSR